MTGGRPTPGALEKNISRRPDPKLVAEYQLPYVGRLEIFDSSHEPLAAQVHGKYWGRVERLGHVGRYSSTEIEATQRAQREISHYLAQKGMDLRKELDEVLSAHNHTAYGIIHSKKFNSWNEYKVKKGDKK